MRLYKTITVFSTLIAVVCVVFGFVLLDAATLQVSALRSLVTALLTAVGVPVDRGVLSALLAVVGLATIGFGAGVYTIGTRFRARGMGKSQEDSGEGSNNG
nr:valine--tRNA ligase [Halegenticoccus soli]